MQVPIEVRNLILLIGLILQVHWLLWYYFDIEFGSEKAFWEVVAGGGVAAIYATSSGGTQEWIQRTVSDCPRFAPVIEIAGAFDRRGPCYRLPCFAGHHCIAEWA